jgi:hypothetical protein
MKAQMDDYQIKIGAKVATDMSGGRDAMEVIQENMRVIQARMEVNTSTAMTVCQEATKGYREKMKAYEDELWAKLKPPMKGRKLTKNTEGQQRKDGGHNRSRRGHHKVVGRRPGFCRPMDKGPPRGTEREEVGDAARLIGSNDVP